MGKAVEVSGGKIDKFIGDGVMALFGIQKSPKEACLSALRAARSMSEGIQDLNFHLKEDLENPIKIGNNVWIGPNTTIFPGTTISPPNFLIPSLLPAESLPFLELPAAFLCAIFFTFN